VAFQVAWLDGPGGPPGIEDAELAPVGATIARWPGGTDEDLRRFVGQADAILCDATPITADLLDRAPRVQIVSEYGIGYDNIDVGAASQRGIWVANVPGFCAPEVADHTLALLLAANRSLLPLDRSIRRGEWDAIGAAGGTQRLGGQTLGLVGFGAIGRSVARRARAFGMRVLAHSPHVTPELAREHGAEAASFEDVLRLSDYVSLHLPGGPATRHLIDSAALARMKPTAWLINTSRGSVVDESALLDALGAGRLGGAALDVRQTEGPSADDPYCPLPNVILTPHAGYYSQQSLIELRRRAARNVAAVLTGSVPNDPVNPNIVPRRERIEGDRQVWV
jgi:D-3-phosphoglycerate dehydrogenase